MRAVDKTGDGRVQTEQGWVRASGVLPTERVRLDDVRRTGKARRGRLAAILVPSAERVEPVCPVAARCGGCSLMHASARAQEAIKLALVDHAVGAVGARAPERLSAGPALAYRRRARMHFERRRLGYRRRRSDRLVDVERCVVLAPAVADALAAVREDLLPRLSGRGEARLGVSPTQRPIVHLRSTDPQPPEVYEALGALVSAGRLGGAALASGGATVPATWGDAAEGSVALDGAPLAGPVAGFGQANDEINRRLVERVVALARADGARVLELFCGHGNFTVPLAMRAAELTAAEHDEAAADACRANLVARGVKARVRTTSAVEAARDAREVDVVVLDPPRAGAGEATGEIARVARREGARVVYVSCDPDSLRHDLKVLHGAGLRVDAVEAFDMFPQTAHVETVVRLVR